MMKKCFLALASLALVTFSAAQAAEKPGQWYITPSLSAIWVDGSRHADDDFGGHLALGRAFEGWNAEIGAWYYDLDGFNETEMWGVDINALKVWFPEGRISPYLRFGYGYMDTENEIYDDEGGDQGSIGLGFLTDITKNGSLAIRAEFAKRWDFSGGSTLQDYVGNIGLQIPFGGKKEEPVVAAVDPDSDGDGVPDSRDRCPGTPAGVKVDANGCPLDSDGDGVPDYLDKCPNTPAGTPVDSKGCPLDSDGDGVLDNDDQCPDTPAGVRVDVRGCEIKAVTELTDVEFEHNSADLTAASRAALADDAASIRKYPDMKVVVAGHTDSAGAEDYNQGLSERRAQSVVDYLISEGVSAANVTAVGYGESQPVADNSTSEGRARNRRVELRIKD